MNIHISKLLEKMEQELQLARQAGDENRIREHVLVVQSLCEVILDSGQASAPASFSSQNQAPGADEFTALELQKMMGISQQKSSVSSQNVLKEDDANGHSLFDF
ncbi:hypothetical protein GJU40_03020 [Bacillus lacus]|uniref:YwdI family protein n=1 Tax=Metabacillus lacus TaxID=1983721 RepID=A0A7X2IX92_9BACI|nr:YwdI family protein [Metabacillus lacus]MRX71142.1 hypothetical protein [Metabacillus lacus]